MKKLLFVLYAGIIITLPCCVLLVSCHKDNDNNDTTSVVTSINATVENGTVYNLTIDSVKAIIGNSEAEYMVVAKGKYKTGGFSIDLPETVDRKYLKLTNDPDGIVTINVNNPSAKTCYINVIKAYKSGIPVGEFRYAIYPTTTNSSTRSDVAYIYADSDVKLTGSPVCPSCNMIATNYNLSLKKGWNIAYSTQHNTEPVTVTNIAPSGLKWYYEKYE